jgi:hypothetical protein
MVYIYGHDLNTGDPFSSRVAIPPMTSTLHGHTNHRSLKFTPTFKSRDVASVNTGPCVTAIVVAITRTRGFPIVCVPGST